MPAFQRRTSNEKRWRDGRPLTGQAIEKASSPRRSAAAAWELAFLPLHRQCPELGCIRQHWRSSRAASPGITGASRCSCFPAVHGAQHAQLLILFYGKYTEIASVLAGGGKRSSWAVEIRFGDQLQPTSELYTTKATVCSVDLAVNPRQNRVTKFMKADLDVISHLLKQGQYKSCAMFSIKV